MKDAESPIRIQDRTVPLSGVLSHYENVKLVLQELKNNFDTWSAMYVMRHYACLLKSQPDFKI